MVDSIDSRTPSPAKRSYEDSRQRFDVGTGDATSCVAYDHISCTEISVPMHPRSARESSNVATPIVCSLINNCEGLSLMESVVCSEANFPVGKEREEKIRMVVGNDAGRAESIPNSARGRFFCVPVHAFCSFLVQAGVLHETTVFLPRHWSSVNA